MLRLKSRAQFQAVLAGPTVARTTHFALHQLDLTAATPGIAEPTAAILPHIPPNVAGAAALSTASTAPAAEPQAALMVKRTVVPLFADTTTAWLGAMIPKRWAKRAVTRNAIKRQVYAVTAAHPPPLTRAAYVLRLRATFDRKQFVSASSEQLKQAVRTELQLLLSRAGDGSRPVAAHSGAGSRSRGRHGASP